MERKISARKKKANKINSAKAREKRTVYTADTAERAYKLCLLGLYNKDLAVAFGVSVKTIEYWMRTKDDFNRAVKLGREEADSKVAEKLFKRATGYTVKDHHISVYRGKVIVTPYDKEYPPETDAAKFWLKNRQPEKWSDTARLEHSGNIKVTEEKKYDLSDLTDEELAAIEKIGFTQMLELDTLDDDRIN